MVDIATLGLAVDSRQVKTATADLGKLTQSGDKAEKQAAKLGSAFGKLSGVIGGITLAGFVNKLKDTEREFGILSSSLKTATGSTAAASVKFAELEKTASKLPESLQDTVSAFIKLKNLGLDPSERSILAYSNTAAAMGKSLNQMIEAVADASTGEFERLKEFGIRASKEGDNVTLTFKGVETTIRNTSDNIQKYLLRLGEVDFAGASADRMATLDGALSNLGDAWDGLFRKINNAGVGSAIQSSVKEMADALSDPATISAAESLASGTIRAFNSIASAATTTVNVVKFVAEEIAASLHGAAADDIVRIEDQLANLQKARNANFASRLIDGFTDKELDAEISRLSTLRDAYYETQKSAAGLAAQPVAPTIPPEAIESIKSISKEQEKAAKEAERANKQRLKGISETVAAIEKEAATYGMSAGEVKLYDLALLGASSSQIALAQSALETVDALMEQEAAFDRQIELMDRADQLRGESLPAESRAIEELQDKYRELADAVEAGVISQEEAAKTAAGLAERWQEGVDKANEATDSMSVFAKRAAENMQDAFADFLFDPFADGLDGMLKNFGQILQRMVAEAAAAEIFDAVLGKQGAGGQRSGGVDWGSLAASFVGLFDTGGNIPSGGWGIAGEKGPEIIRGPATVISRENTSKMMQGGSSNVFNFNLPGITNAQEAKQAQGMLQRTVARAVAQSQRYF